MPPTGNLNRHWQSKYLCRLVTNSERSEHVNQSRRTQHCYPLPGSLTDEAIAVRGALLERGLETPMINNGLNRDQRYEVIREAFGDIMNALGLDLRDDSLEETPHRIAKMYVARCSVAWTTRNFPKSLSSRTR